MVKMLQLAQLTDELDIHLVAGMLERDERRLYNTAVIIGPDGVVDSAIVSTLTDFGDAMERKKSELL